MKTVFTLFIVCFFTYSSFAQPGTLDSSFGADGLVLKNFDEPLSALFNKGIVLPDDKIMEVGNIGAAFGAVRYYDDGSADKGFGKNGVALINFPKLSSVAYNVAQQTDGKLLLTGYGVEGFMESAIFHGLIVRLKQDGSVDSSFGDNGVIERTTPHRYTAGFGAIAVLPDNSFIVYGYSDGSGYVNKFTQNGALDKSFGENGYVYLSFNYGFRTCKIQPDGKIVLAGSYYYGGLQQFYLQRLLPDGSVDDSFGINGSVTTITYPVEDILYDMAFQSDGKIVVTGTENYYSIITSRYTIDGKLDSSFGINGKSNFKLLNMSINGKAIAIANDDKIVLGGTTESTDLFSANDAVIGLTADGRVDSSFGNAGITITDFGDGFGDQVISLGLQKSGKIVTIGSTTSHNDYYSSLARYINNESQKQIIITKIKRWLQHHNGFTWDNNSNISSYVVQRSYDGIHFSSIARINAKNSSNAYADPLPLSANNYYRLQTTSVNGAVNYSNVIAITANESAITTSPNPAKNNLQIQGLSPSNKTKLTVVDFSGNVKQQAVVNTSSYNLNIAALAPGNYLLKIEMNDAVVTKKFVKE